MNWSSRSSNRHPCYLNWQASVLELVDFLRTPPSILRTFLHSQRFELCCDRKSHEQSIFDRADPGIHLIFLSLPSTILDRIIHRIRTRPVPTLMRHASRNVFHLQKQSLSIPRTCSSLPSLQRKNYVGPTFISWRLWFLLSFSLSLSLSLSLSQRLHHLEVNCIAIC